MTKHKHGIIAHFLVTRKQARKITTGGQVHALPAHKNPPLSKEKLHEITASLNSEDMRKYMSLHRHYEKHRKMKKMALGAGVGRSFGGGGSLVTRHILRGGGISDAEKKVFDEATKALVAEMPEEIRNLWNRPLDYYSLSTAVAGVPRYDQWKGSEVEYRAFRTEKLWKVIQDDRAYQSSHSGFLGAIKSIYEAYRDAGPMALVDASNIIGRIVPQAKVVTDQIEETLNSEGKKHSWEELGGTTEKIIEKAVDKTHEEAEKELERIKKEKKEQEKREAEKAKEKAKRDKELQKEREKEEKAKPKPRKEPTFGPPPPVETARTALKEEKVKKVVNKVKEAIAEAKKKQKKTDKKKKKKKEKK